jgi:hypothetical protein
LQSTDWGSVVQRRATREPVEKGGWSVFHTWFTSGFTLNPVVSAPFRGLGAAGWFGWYENPKIEQLTQEWLDAKDEDARKKIAAAIQLENRSGADGDARPVPDSYSLPQEPGREVGIHRAAILECQTGLNDRCGFRRQPIELC